MNYSPIRLLVLFAISVSLFAGCSAPYSQTSGTPIDPEKVAKIVKGTTTRAEIETMFGRPEFTNLLPDGRRAMSYQYTESKARSSVTPVVFTARVRGTTRTQTLQIYLNSDGVVEDFEFNDTTRDLSHGPGGTTTTAPR